MARQVRSIRESNTADRILNAALDLCELEGSESITMRAVGERAGIVAMAVYRHFENKDALLEAVADEGHRRLLHYLNRIPPEASPVDQLRAGRRRFIDFALEHSYLYDLMFVRQPLSEALPREGRDDIPDSFRPLRDAIANCMRAGVFRADDTTEVSLMIWAVEHGLIQLYRAGLFDDERAFRETVESVLERLYRGLKAE